MLLPKDQAAHALERAISDALDSGITGDEIGQMATAQEIRTLNQLAMELGEAATNDELPVYPVAPPGMIDLATAKRDHGVKPSTARDWIDRGELPVLGRIRGRGGTRYLVCEKTIAQKAKLPKNRGGRPRKTPLTS